MGYDLRGVMWWTLVDNFEWAFGYRMKFGVYRWDPNTDQKRVLHSSGALLKTWYARLVEKCPRFAREAAARKKGGTADDGEVRELVGAATA